MPKVKLPIYQRTQLVGGDYGTGDDHYDSTVLHLSFDDLNAARTKDYSPSNRLPIDAAGTAAITRDQSRFPAGPKGPTGCLVLDGDDDWIEYSVSTDFHPNVAYTIEAHIYIDPTADQPNTILGSRNSIGGAGQGGWWFISQGNGLSFVGWNGDVGGSVVTSTTNNNVIGSPSRLPLGEWMHVAAARDVSGSPVIWRTFKDGILQNWDTEQAPGIKENTTESTYVGREINNTTRDFHGYIDNVRITRGVCRYTENFTPPQAPYPNYKKRGPATSIYPSTNTDPYFDNVVLLLPFDGTDGDTTTTDYSPSAHSMTFFANGQIDDAKAKFGPTSYVGDGSSDLVYAPDSADWDFGTGDFTIELWVNLASVTGTELYCMVSHYTSSVSGFTLQWRNDSYVGSVWTLVNGWGDTQINAYATGTPTVDQWYHVAWAREGTTSRLFLDGALVDSDTNSTNMTGSTQTLNIGGLRTSSPTFSVWGNIDDVRITKGVARYTGAFTPPTQAHPTQ